jgi:hypothetical protein
MAELHRNLSFGWVWKGFRSAVTSRQNSFSDVVDRDSVNLDHRDPNALKLGFPSSYDSIC